MNIIVTGPKGVGKSTSLLNAAQRLKAAGTVLGGVISRGLWNGDRRAGYEIVHPATGNTLLLCSRGEPRGDTIEDVIRHGSYYFFKPAFFLGNNWIREGLAAEVLFIDEIGTIETRERAGENAGWDFRLPLLYACAKKPVLVFGAREEAVKTITEGWHCPWKTIRLEAEQDLTADILAALRERTGDAADGRASVRGPPVS